MSTPSSSFELYRARSATDVITLTFRFLRDQFAPLLKALLLLAGPPLILSSVLGSFVGLAPTAGPPGMTFLLQIICALIGSVIAAVVSIGAIEVYQREGRDGLTPRRLWGLVRVHGLALFGRQIQLGLIVGAGAVVIGMIGGGIGSALGQLAGGVGPLAIGGLIGGALLIGWLLYAYPRFALLLPGQMDPERSISLSRCVALVRGRWGQTLGVLLLALVISLIIFSVGWLPQFVLGVLQGIGMSPSGPVGPLLAGIVSGVGNVLSSAVTNTALTFQYYNLVEQHEQVSLSEDVERMEQNTASRDASTEEPDAPATDEKETSPDSDDSARWRGDASTPPSN